MSIKALDDTKYHKYLVALSTLRPEHHTKDPTIFDELNSHLTRDTDPKEVVALADKYLPGNVAREFGTLVLNLTAGLPKLADILADPENASVPSDPHFQYVVSSAIAKNVNRFEPNDNVSAYAKYLARLLPDIASMAAHDIEAKSPEIMTEELKALRIYYPDEK